MAAAAGVFLAIDLVLWHHAIEDVGAGLATVLANVQVALVPLLAWVLLRERPAARLLACLPVLLLGIVLISGVGEPGAYGADPLRGAVFGAVAGVTYAAFLLLLRSGGQDLRRPAGPLFDLTVVATVVCVLIGLVWGDAHVVPTWPAHGWLVLLALTSQVLGWLLIGSSLPRLPAALTSVLLTIQPVGSMLLGLAIFGEAPSAIQLAGCVLLLGAIVAVARR
jgi:drug/metabolite transporter (DMT)-like permease